MATQASPLAEKFGITVAHLDQARARHEHEAREKLTAWREEYSSERSGILSSNSSIPALYEASLRIITSGPDEGMEVFRQHFTAINPMAALKIAKIIEGILKGHDAREINALKKDALDQIVEHPSFYSTSQSDINFIYSLCINDAWTGSNVHPDKSEPFLRALNSVASKGHRPDEPSLQTISEEFARMREAARKSGATVPVNILQRIKDTLPIHGSSELQEKFDL